MDSGQQVLTHALFESGLIQVGAFTINGQSNHIKLNLGLLPSYPAILRDASALFHKLIRQGLNRIICAPDAIALATAVSVHTTIPLVWHSGQFGAPSHHFIGAYDIEHPAVLITLTGSRYSADELAILYHEAGSVGLQIQQHLCLIDDSIIPNNSIGLVTLADAVRYSIEMGFIPRALGETALTEVG